MNTNKTLIFATLFLSSVSVNAATITLSPSTNLLQINDTLNVDLVIDFTSDATLGGGLDISYDYSAFNFISFDFNTAITLDPTFTRYITTDGELTAIEFGEFNGIGGSGSTLIGTFSMQGIGYGTSNISMAVQESIVGKAGPFVSAIAFGVQNPVLQDALAIEISAVPIPAAAWLMLSGLGLLGTVFRKTK